MKRKTATIKVCFCLDYSHITRQAQYNHPCYTSCYLYTTSDRAKPTPIIPGPAHTQFTPHSALVPANPYLLEEIPAWLLIYVDGRPNSNHSTWKKIIRSTYFHVFFLYWYFQPIQLLIINWNGTCSNCLNWNVLIAWCSACSNKRWKH